MLLLQRKTYRFELLGESLTEIPSLPIKDLDYTYNTYTHELIHKQTRKHKHKNEIFVVILSPRSKSR